MEQPGSVQAPGGARVAAQCLGSEGQCFSFTLLYITGAPIGCELRNNVGKKSYNYHLVMTVEG